MRVVRNLSRISNFPSPSPKYHNVDPSMFNGLFHYNIPPMRHSSSSESMKCPKCGYKLNSNCALFCSSSTCLKIQKIDPQKCNIYELFSLGPLNYDIDLDIVDTNYRNLQKVMHPDKFGMNRTIKNGNEDDREDREISLENSAFINHANHVLKSSIERAFYILSMKGIDYGQEGKTIKNQDFMVSFVCFI
jgi:hypothetical protein